MRKHSHDRNRHSHQKPRTKPRPAHLLVATDAHAVVLFRGGHDPHGPAEPARFRNEGVAEVLTEVTALLFPYDTGFMRRPPTTLNKAEQSPCRALPGGLRRLPHRLERVRQGVQNWILFPEVDRDAPKTEHRPLRSTRDAVCHHHVKSRGKVGNFGAGVQADDKRRLRAGSHALQHVAGNDSTVAALSSRHLELWYRSTVPPHSTQSHYP